MVWPALIGAGATLLGGLFGSKKKAQPEVTKTETTSTVDYVKMAEEAQKAGFNPLTAIRNGGSAGFGSGTSISTQPALSTSPDYGALFGNFGAAIADAFDPVARKQRQVESALYDYQLKTLQSGGKMPKGIGGAPTKAASRYAVQRVGSLGRKVAPGTMIVPGDNPTQSSLGLEQFGWVHNPDIPDAAVFEQIYGEPGSWVGGVVKFGADAKTTAGAKLGRIVGDYDRQLKRIKAENRPISAAVGDSYWTKIEKSFEHNWGLPNMVRKGGRFLPAKSNW